MWVQLLVSFLMMIISSALQPSAVTAQKDVQPGKLDIPTAEEGGPVAVIFGTCLVKTSNVIWYGNASTTPIQVKAESKK
jgi:hypothetical protein